MRSRADRRGSRSGPEGDPFVRRSGWKPSGSLPPLRSLGIRAAKASFSGLLDEVEAGTHVLLCRRSKPVAALIPPVDLERFRELLRREEELGAVLRARGHAVEPLTTAQLIEVMVSHLDAPRPSTGGSAGGTPSRTPPREGEA